MTILISNSVDSTVIFILFFLTILFLSVKKTNEDRFLSRTVTEELKGLAILAVIFSHIGYFLVSDHSFLFPFSIIAGVGVDLFLFLSGYGLTCRYLKKELKIAEFYYKRLLKLFVPLWASLIVFIGLKFFILGIHYDISYITKAFFGIFTTANIYNDLNSPLWYFTLILFYYLLFPLVFSKKRPWLSALIILSISYVFIRQNPQFLQGVIGLYKVHYWAFPLGILGSWFLSAKKNITLKPIIRYFLIAGAMTLVGYFSYHSGVGGTPLKEQLISLFIVALIVFIFSYKKIEFKLLSVFGIFSYEIYLLHWPLIYNHNFLFSYTPAWLAVFLYLALFLGFGWLLQWCILKTR